MKAQLARMLSVFATLVAGQLLVSVALAQNLSKLPDEKIISDAYVYLLGRALVIRQERLDITKGGLQYNVAHHNPLALSTPDGRRRMSETWR